MFFSLEFSTLVLYYCTEMELKIFRTREPREVLFQDRTPCHADHLGDGSPTAAVGIVQSVWGLGEQK